jgi:hypothetical protein
MEDVSPAKTIRMLTLCRGFVLQMMSPVTNENENKNEKSKEE